MEFIRIQTKKNTQIFIMVRRVYSSFFKDTFCPGSEVCLISLGGLKGKSYREKKEAARNKAIEYSLNIYPGLSWGECSEIQSYFENIGKRYGLLKEFRENAII